MAFRFGAIEDGVLEFKRRDRSSTRRSNRCAVCLEEP
jgi:hypothetical protein